MDGPYTKDAAMRNVNPQLDDAVRQLIEAAGHYMTQYAAVHQTGGQYGMAGGRTLSELFSEPLGKRITAEEPFVVGWFRRVDALFEFLKLHGVIANRTFDYISPESGERMIDVSFLMDRDPGSETPHGNEVLVAFEFTRYGVVFGCSTDVLGIPVYFDEPISEALYPQYAKIVLLQLLAGQLARRPHSAKDVAALDVLMSCQVYNFRTDMLVPLILGRETRQTTPVRDLVQLYKLVYRTDDIWTPSIECLGVQYYGRGGINNAEHQFKLQYDVPGTDGEKAHVQVGITLPWTAIMGEDYEPRRGDLVTICVANFVGTTAVKVMPAHLQHFYGWPEAPCCAFEVGLYVGRNRWLDRNPRGG